MTPGLQRTTSLALAVAPLLLVVLFVLNDGIPLQLRLLVAGMAVLAAASPLAALLAIAAIGPLAPLVSEMTGAFPTMLFLQAAALAALAGWLLRGPAGTPAGTPFTRAVRLVFAAIVVASAAALLLRLWQQVPGTLVTLLFDQSRLHWWAPDQVGISATIHLLTGIGVFALAMDVAGRDDGATPRVVRMLVLGGVAAASLSLLLVLGIGSARMTAWHARFALERFAGHITDVNAAGSYFAMVLALAVGGALRARGLARAAWAAAAAMILGGVLLSGSRSAYAAVAIVGAGAALWQATAGRGTRTRVLVAAGAGLLVVGAFAVAVADLPLNGAGLRSQFNETSLRIIAAQPVFGVGIGQYYGLSLLALTPELAWLYATENAHNYFLQVGAELGLVGGAAFVLLVASALWQAARTRRGGPATAGALVTGAAAYLITCVTGHPLLVMETALPFWILLGLAAVAPGAPGASPGAAGARRRLGAAAPVAAVVILAASVPFRTAPPDVRLPEGFDGLGPVNRDRDGRTFRETREYFAIYVDPRATRVRIPLRISPTRRGRPLTVGDQIPGWAQHSTEVGDAWTVLDLELPGAPPGIPGQRVNLRVYDGGARPDDPRDPGLWVGEVTSEGGR
ncbi:MAG: O-antigen ligase family protein [Vicinamibacterales bacterium]